MTDPFLLWPDPRLRARAAPVGAVTEAHRAIWERMEAAMRAMPGHGVGLAAPQIGVPLRLAIIDAGESGLVRLADPEIVEASEELREHEEASPNLPGVSALVKRPATVTVRWRDETEAEHVRRFERLEATSVQHQIDHLEGRLYPDRLGPVKRKMLLDRYAKLRRRG
ncbi:MAG: peptide deformylase [Pikeienuella sp.]|uniref:peptide deformylase n=1 Tax=Pikeienuella sp. TaxID=2831957 RepID=UPI00391C6F49